MSKRRATIVTLTLWALPLALGACREPDALSLVTADARAFFGCEEIEVRYAGSYAAPTPDTSVELYEVFAACGGEATYRCEIVDDGESAASSSCCRFGDPLCDGDVVE